MSVIRTDKWLQYLYDKPIQMCEKIRGHFDGTSAYEIYNHLVMFGMYRFPTEDGKELTRSLQKNNIWQVLKEENRQLQRLWDGPDVPVYIFPSDSTNQKMKREQNGKSGLAFKDKLFLFITENTKEQELRALFTHEYNHVCRLSNYPKTEEDYVLLDTIILEGLAENAVTERFEDYSASWTAYYSEEKLQKLWKEFVLPHKNTPNSHYKHLEILYGSRRVPKMSGYCLGYYLVKKYMMKNNLTSKDLLGIDSEKIAQI